MMKLTRLHLFSILLGILALLFLLRSCSSGGSDLVPPEGLLSADREIGQALLSDLRAAVPEGGTVRVALIEVRKKQGSPASERQLDALRTADSVYNIQPVYLRPAGGRELSPVEWMRLGTVEMDWNAVAEEAASSGAVAVVSLAGPPPAGTFPDTLPVLFHNPFGPQP